MLSINWHIQLKEKIIFIKFKKVKIICRQLAFLKVITRRQLVTIPPGTHCKEYLSTHIFFHKYRPREGPHWYPSLLWNQHRSGHSRRDFPHIWKHRKTVKLGGPCAPCMHWTLSYNYIYWLWWTIYVTPSCAACRAELLGDGRPGSWPVELCTWHRI